jgi:DNA-binding helix-hairpin-helix protein with protein kinase domain
VAPSHPSSSNSVRLIWPSGRVERVNLIPIGKSGGAGEIFAIEGRPELLAKIYHSTTTPAKLAHYAEKIRWMIDNKPDLPEIPAEYQGIVQLAWPIAVVARQSHFAGFVMEKIDFHRTMELDYLLTHRQAEQQGFAVDFGKLVTVCYNLASLINCLHSKKIAVVDLKPVNLKVYKSELYVSILDCDGFRIHSDTFSSEAPQVTPEYLAPEFHDKAVSNPEAQDWFALATIIFRLLNYGIHPFAGVAAKSRHTAYPAELAGRIQQGLYPYGKMPSKTVRAVPASVHESLPDSIRELFDRSFLPSPRGRPNAYEWATVLGTYANRSTGQMIECSSGHLQFSEKPCPGCLRETIIKGHVERRKHFLTQLQTSPARTFNYVRKTLRGTHSSPFQAALAQGHINLVQLAPSTLSTRNAIALEILWIAGLLTTYWWTK